MLQVKHIDHINLSVVDLDASLRFYAAVFGFEKVEEGVFEGLPWAIIRVGEAMLCLYENPDRPFVDRHKRPVQGMNHFGLRITDRSAWEAIVEREKLEVLYDGATDWPHSTAWYIEDPTGYEIEVVLWDEDKVSFAGVNCSGP